jgi:hypothetical protein
VDPRADLDDVEKRKILTLPGIELRSLCRPARSESLYRLSYPGSSKSRVDRKQTISEGRGSTLLLNVYILLPHYTESHPIGYTKEL